MKIDERALKAAMRKMGIQSQDIIAREVIIKAEGKDIIISNPQVQMIKGMGADSFQITGTVTERTPQVAIAEDDVQTVMLQANVDRERATKALKSHDGDIAAAIISLQEESKF